MYMVLVISNVPIPQDWLHATDFSASLIDHSYEKWDQ